MIKGPKIFPNTRHWAYNTLVLSNVMPMHYYLIIGFQCSNLVRILTTSGRVFVRGAYALGSILHIYQNLKVVQRRCRYHWTNHIET
jgi:hypothetical protein